MGKYLVIDTESIVLGKNTPGPIIQLGLVSMDGITGKLISKAQWFIKSDVPLTPRTTELTGITQTQVNGGITLSKALKEIKKVYGYHNIPVFGWGSDNLHITKQVGSLQPFKDYTNFQLLYSVCYKNSNGDRVGLRNAMKDHGLEFEGTQHQAVDDAYNTARLIQKLLFNRNHPNT